MWLSPGRGGLQRKRKAQVAQGHSHLRAVLTPSAQSEQDTPWHSPVSTTCFCWNVMTYLPVHSRLDPGPPSLCRDRAPFLVPSAPSGRHQGKGFGTLPSDQPTICTGCWWQQSGEVTSGTSVHGAPCLLARCGVLQAGKAGQVRRIKCAGGCTPALRTGSLMAVFLILQILGRPAAMNSQSINVSQPDPSLSTNRAINTLRPGKPSPGRARTDTKEDIGGCWLSEAGSIPACTH